MKLNNTTETIDAKALATVTGGGVSIGPFTFCSAAEVKAQAKASAATRAAACAAGRIN